jgi:hypothetical protein
VSPRPIHPKREHRGQQVNARKKEGHMADTKKTEAVLESVQSLYTEHFETVRNSGVEAFKKCQAVYRKYLDSLAEISRESPYPQAARNYLEGLQTSWATQDAHRYAAINREYLSAVEQSQLTLQKRHEEAYRDFVEQLRHVAANTEKSQRVEFENFIKGIQNAFARIDIKSADVATVAKVGEGIVAAAYLRAMCP